VTASGAVRLFGISAQSHSVHALESTPLTSGLEWTGTWADLGGEATGPVAVLLDAESLVHVFIRGVNRALWHLSETYNRSEFLSLPLSLSLSHSHKNKFLMASYLFISASSQALIFLACFFYFIIVWFGPPSH
jgi:hypothetical protein